MALAPGTRLGVFRLTELIGRGGMGEVFRARDTKLDRDVAIKILPEAFAHDTERLARFQREAKTLASLNHPNIAAIYGLEEGGGVTALVMELVEGDDLSQRIAQRSHAGRVARSGPAEGAGLPIDEALPIAKQIAEALEAAHGQGIIHRDLKPANIKVRSDGTVKVLDFGLAKALEPAAGSSPSMSMAPTITTPALMTGAGIILGTAAYMAPEQARGKVVDKRADIWAFGAVLFEMLTGKRPFDGEDMTEVLGAVVRLDPPWETLPSDVPPLVRTLLQNCLTKDPRRRVADISTALFVLEMGASLAPPATAVLAAPLPRRSLWQRVVTPVAAASVASVIVGAGVWFATRPVPLAQASVRFEIRAPGASPVEMFTLSADGRALAFIANTGGPNQLWVRAMDALESRPLAGTDGATYPFWSPDGAYLGFFAQGKLRKIAVGGGPAQTLCDAADGRGGTWNHDGVILFSAGPSSPILRVAAAGGVPAPVTRILEGDVADGHRFPVFLPDGVHFLFNANSNKPDATGLYAGSLDGAAPARLLPDQTNALYVPPGVPGKSGHLVFRREDTLMAQSFDPRALMLAGEMFPLAAEVSNSVNIGFGAFSVADAGTLVYRTGGPAANRELAWVDRTGRRLSAASKPGAFNGSPALSPDARTAAVRINVGSQSDIWLQDMNRDVASRFSFSPSIDTFPVWSPDGSRLGFSSQPSGGATTDLYQKRANGNGQEELLLHGGVNAFIGDWSSDGKWLVYQQQGPTTALDLWLLPTEGDRKPVVYLQTPFTEALPRFAPAGDGAPRWMAYQSNESGQAQIYVQAIPASGAKYQVSTSGGTRPMWRRDGKELFYVSSDLKLMAVPIALGASVDVGTPQELFANAGMTGYAPSADGQRFLLNVPAGGEAAAAPPVTVVLNWQAGLNK